MIDEYKKYKICQLKIGMYPKGYGFWKHESLRFGAGTLIRKTIIITVNKTEKGLKPITKRW